MSRIRQLALALPGRPALGREDFFVSPANALALARLDQWPRWTPPKLVVTGPPGSGKSHLAAVWAAMSGGAVLAAADLRADPGDLPRHLAVEDADRIAGDADAETALFHAHNIILDRGGSLLLTGRAAPAHWGLALPDLVSRIAAADTVALAPPDDVLLSAVLVKLFDDRQLIVTPDVVSYLVKRIARSFAEAERVVARLDSAALSLRRRVTRALAAEVLSDET